VIEDLVGEFFESGGIGALRILSDERLIASASVSTDRADSDDISMSARESAGCSSGRIGHLANDAGIGGGVRSNVGYFNPNSFEVAATFFAEREDGSTLGEVGLRIPGYSQVQYPVFALVSTVPESERSLAEFSIRYDSSGPLSVYGVAVRNQSGGGNYFPADCP